MAECYVIRAATKGVWTKLSLEDYLKYGNRSMSVTGTLKRPYIQQSHNGKPVRVHRLFMDAPKGMDVDHINGDPTDNRRSNLRVCTRQQNLWNQSIGHANTAGYKGVSARNNVWVAEIDSESLGVFRDPQSAAKVYDLAVIKRRGEYGQLNFTDGERAYITVREQRIAGVGSRFLDILVDEIYASGRQKEVLAILRGM